MNIESFSSKSHRLHLRARRLQLPPALRALRRQRRAGAGAGLGPRAVHLCGDAAQGFADGGAAGAAGTTWRNGVVGGWVVASHGGWWLVVGYGGWLWWMMVGGEGFLMVILVEHWWTMVASGSMWSVSWSTVGYKRQ